MKFKFAALFALLAFASITTTACFPDDGKDRLMSWEGRRTQNFNRICQIPTLNHRPDEQYYQVLMLYIGSVCHHGVGYRDGFYYIPGGIPRFANALNLKHDALYKFNLKEETIYAINVTNGKHTLLSPPRRKAINAWFIKNVINNPKPYEPKL